jgi:hypothetical protein
LNVQAGSEPVGILARRFPHRTNDAELPFDLLRNEGAARITLQALGHDAVAGMIAEALGAVGRRRQATVDVPTGTAHAGCELSGAPGRPRPWDCPGPVQDYSV